ncbi:solute carrier family 35 member G1-like [Apostichopus japonicus]|uniref:solute carrier family 35 member G1-like n=1 Tax=Stichopus japonicus TaxID=307972 RepID=UPI003AB3B7DD
MDLTTTGEDTELLNKATSADERQGGDDCGPAEVGSEPLSPRKAIKLVWDVCTRRIGICFSLLAGTTIGLQLSTVKALPSISPYQIMFFRSFSFFISILCTSWQKSATYDVYDLVYYFGYGISNTCGLMLTYVALQFGHVGNVTAISLNLPIPAAILGYLFLQESITCYDVVLFIVNLTGIVLVTKPPFIFGLDITDTEIDTAEPSKSYDEFYGAIISIFALLGIVASTTFSRKLAYRGSSDASLVTVVTAICGVVLSGGILLFTQTWDPVTSLTDITMLVGISTLSLLANLFIVLGLKYENVLLVSVLITFCVPVSFLVGIFVLQEIPDLISIIGAGLTLISTFLCLWK